MNHEKAICIKKNKWTKRKLIQNPFLVSDKRNWSKHIYSSDIVGMSGLRTVHKLWTITLSSLAKTSVFLPKSTIKNLYFTVWTARDKTINCFILSSISCGSYCRNSISRKNHKNIEKLNPFELLLNMISMILKISYNNQNHSSLKFLKKCNFI